MKSIMSQLLPLLFHLATTITALNAFDLNSLLAVFGVSSSAPVKACPQYCNCTRLRAEDVMMRYLDSYLPDMGVHMNPMFESDARSTITFMTLWLGHMADISCHLPTNETANISEILQTSPLSFKALKVRCEPDAKLVWDLTHFSAFISVLDIDGCEINKADSAKNLPVPINLWILQLDRIAPEIAPLLDISAAIQMLAFSWTRSGLVTLPQHWSSVTLRSVMFINLAFNNLDAYNCPITATNLVALNLNHNNLRDLPDCVLNGSKYTSFLSMRHNYVDNLNFLILHTPYQAHDITNSANNSGTSDPNPQLSYLDLAHNQLESLHPLRKIHLLTGLDLSYNQISIMDQETFTLHPYLKWLDLSYNQLTHVPDGALINLIMLSYLNISHNRLIMFNFDQSPLSSRMLDIDLRYNQLSYPPFSDTGYIAPRQTRLTIAYNPFICDCNLSPFLRLMTGINNSNSTWFGYWDNYEHDGHSMSQPYIDSNLLKCNEPSDMRDMPLNSLDLTKNCRLLRSCPVGCVCQLFREGSKRVVIDCSDKVNVTELPFEVPVVKDTPLVLLLNRSGLKRLDHRPYLSYLTELYAGYSKISYITSGAMEAMENITVLSLHNNQLRSLPAVTQNLSMPVVSNISLAGNPWTCGCHDLWMPRWLEDHAAAVYDGNDTRCRWTGEMVTDLNGTDLRCGIFNYLPLVMALTMLLGLVAVVTSLLIKYRLEVLVFLYTRFNIRPFDMYQYKQNRSFLFDVFVSFSQHDCQWVADKLVDHLENRDKPYRLCIHLRDFHAGAPIAESISWAVTNSRCMLLVLTKHFMASEWCRHELRTAHTRLLKDRQAKLLVIVHGPLDARALDRELLAYLRTHTYLRTEDKWFWGKLEYALPRPMGNTPHYIMPGSPSAAPDGRLAHANHRASQPRIDLDNLPIAMAAGDVSPKRGSAASTCVSVPL